MQAPMHQSKRAGLRAFFSRLFHPVNPVALDKVQAPGNGGDPATGFFPQAQNFTVSNSTLIYTEGTHDVITQVMSALSKRVMVGAEHDSSARDPPPRCHPGTRVGLHGMLNSWFHDKWRQKALLWLSGPAGVGKSAVIQTFAESLAASKHLGASLFFSRPNNRKDPQRVFITIAFQLATKIPSYRMHIIRQIAFNPSLLAKGMREQFRIFIAEPFGTSGVEKGEGPWGVLLDGLDECEGVDQQSEIVQLISEFVLNFPNSPLVWIIASRPEPHIVTTFSDDVIAPGHWAKYIPIDSTEACQDVERYLNASFRTLRRQFPHIPPTWPSETQFLKLSHGALGLFVFAMTAVRFMGDPDHADPVSRLNLLLSVIDHLEIPVTDDHPFALLDALYKEILLSIPPTTWPISKKILGFALCVRSDLSDVEGGLSYVLQSRSLLGASIIFGLEQNLIYASLHKLHSVLKIPRRENAHKSGVSFFHSSFADYLRDTTRSKDLFIDCGDTVDDITHSLYELYLDKPWDSKWARYTSELSRLTGRNFYRHLKRDAEASLYHVVTGDLRTERGRGPFVSERDRSECLVILSQLNTANVPSHDGDGGCDFVIWLFELRRRFPEELEKHGLLKEILLRDLKLDHLDCQGNKPLRIRSRKSKVERVPLDSSRALQQFISELRSLQLNHPSTLVIICGGTPEKRNAFIHRGYLKVINDVVFEYYRIPYPRCLP